ncbi:NADH-quinone oxidoreductase subunit NuoE [Mesoterricola silvestris]|uniref:NADH dehydrogenase n=1 Tax=Mesoterricola silvestris TaxID=2927979 RepID=A0AA48K7S9_9BACT|nr:NADH-quinone oxidoreductase subunit NuoE [Mesoterricola silvestris]BDU72214.1 NADH dehydrogenase [Mesoterricola silvestris]
MSTIANTDNWLEIKAAAVAALPPSVVEFIASLEGSVHSESHLIAILHMVQAETGWLSTEQMGAVAQLAQIPLAKVTGVATFYHYFRLQPRGKHMINVCLGTACYVKGADKISQRLMDNLGIQFGETTKDGMFSLESTRCLGTCGLAPVVMIDDQVHGPVTPGEVSLILEKYLKKEKTAPKA